MDPSNPNILYQGRIQIWKTNNARTAGYPSATCGDWNKISDFINDFGTSFYQAVLALKIAPTNSNYIYAAITPDTTNSYELFKTTVGGGIGMGYWQNKTPNQLLSPNGQTITGIAVSYTDPDHLWISLSGYNQPYQVLESTDGGNPLTWTSVPWVSNSSPYNALPKLPVNCIVYEKGSNDGIYVGTDIGVYYHNNTMTGWEPFMTGLPNVAVNKLEINYKANKIRAATFGRGLWESYLACPQSNLTINYNPISSGFYEAENVTITNATANSGSAIQVRGADSHNLNGPPIVLNTSQGNVLFSQGSNVHLFVHGCDHDKNSFRQQNNNNNSGGNNTPQTIIDKPITQSDNFKFTYYPNPFNDHLHIDFLLDKSSPVLVNVYTPQGQLIQTLANGTYVAGEYTLIFDNSSLKSGVYFVRLDIGDKHYTKGVVKSAE
jgi:hypothetical protein